MAQFDDLVAKYRNLTYGRLASNNPSAIKSLLETTDKSISNPQYFGNINPNQQQYLDTPSGLIAQNRFRIDPQTGIPIFETPASESIKSASGTYDPNIDYGDPGYAGVIPEDPINTELVTGQIAENRGGGDGQRLGFGTTPAEDQGYGYSGIPGEGGSATYNNPAYGSSLLGTGTGDTFTPAPGIGKAYDEYGVIASPVAVMFDVIVLEFVKLTTSSLAGENTATQSFRAAAVPIKSETTVS